MEKRTVTILCSGFGLGLYIPGLLAGRRLAEKKVSTDVHVFENLISKDKRDMILKSKKAYHDKFSLALMSARMPMDIRQSIDPSLVNELL
ncbi:MAG TPA: UDP-glucuronosyltransferase, partial [Clostridia bacterium]|nr:UDP-glucuronosyltransferase [Clostridia bacterium]